MSEKSGFFGYRNSAGQFHLLTCPPKISPVGM
jgi:hypothetical protein